MDRVGTTSSTAWTTLATMIAAALIGGLVGGSLVLAQSADAAAPGTTVLELRKVTDPMFEVPFSSGGGQGTGVECEPDELLVGGGFGMVRGTPRVLVDEPVFNLDEGVWQWEVIVANDEPGTATRVIPSALCLRVVS